MILQADARRIPLRDGCVQTVVTSPPYFSLRDYGVLGQIGLERTPDEYVAVIVAVFREIRRVLRDDGTAWCNLGDSYAGHNLPGWRDGNEIKNGGASNKNGVGYVPGLKPKDLCGIPWRVAFALQADGWYLRSDIIWAKPNPMPESVTDRPTRSHEYIFLLSKSERYFYDADAIREPWADERNGDPGRAISKYDGSEASGGRRYLNRFTAPGCSGRNKRDVWTVNSEPTPEAHFATFPQKLIGPCVLAGTSEKGCCAECGAPRVRVSERIEGEPKSYHNSSFTNGKTGVNGLGRVSEAPRTTKIATGWQPSCAHDAPSVPCLVLDPFLGSGTVGRVAERFGRRWVGLELSADYIGIAEKRTAQRGIMFGAEA